MCIRDSINTIGMVLQNLSFVRRSLVSQLYSCRANYALLGTFHCYTCTTCIYNAHLWAQGKTVHTYLTRLSTTNFRAHLHDDSCSSSLLATLRVIIGGKHSRNYNIPNWRIAFQNLTHGVPKFLPSSSWPLPGSSNLTCMASSSNDLQESPVGASFAHTITVLP